MARLSKQTAKSRQKGILRYIASTDIERTARHLDVSTEQVKRFARANPETIQKHPERFSKLLAADTKQVAREKDVKLVQRLSGKRLSAVRAREEKSERQIRSIRYSVATRERYRTEEAGKIVYKPINPERIQTSRNQIINNMAGLNQHSIVEMYLNDELDENEARGLMRKLYRNSGLSNARADSKFDELTGS